MGKGLRQKAAAQALKHRRFEKMAAPDGTRQITLFVPADTLTKVDEAAYQIRQRRNDRTTWILQAIDEKLGALPDDARLTGLVNCYESLNEDGKAWLSSACAMAKDHPGFKA